MNDQLLFINLHLQILCAVPMAASANVYEEEMEEEEEEVQEFFRGFSLKGYTKGLFFERLHNIKDVV